MNVIEKLNSIQNKEMTAKENVENFIKVIDEKNEELNIFLEVNKESALKQAEAIDEKIANGEKVGFLSGLVFGIKANINVDATVLVVDAMTGQDAVNVAKTFSEKVGIDGVILTKMDGDTRGGAALSIKAVTGKPLLYVGMGEKLSDLEQFYPERMASRILGMGDVMSLIEKVEASIDQEKAQDMQKKLKKMDFDFNDYLTSMEQMNKMGGISSVLNMLPGVGGKMKDIEGMIDEKAMDRTKSIILSMTPAERSNPGILNISRKNRIAKGAGVDISEVNRLVKQFEQSKKMMKQMPGLMGGKAGKRGGFRLPF